MKDQKKTGLTRQVCFGDPSTARADQATGGGGAAPCASHFER
ncbi:MAG TPA: hypothetical protein VFG22_01710 [Polyangiales bacterium]|nr:hypothetical protein [Polyangiales bacterium]